MLTLKGPEVFAATGITNWWPCLGHWLLFSDLEAICIFHTVFGCCFPIALFPVLLSVLLFLHHVKTDENTCRRMPTPSTPEELQPPPTIPTVLKTKKKYQYFSVSYFHAVRVPCMLPQCFCPSVKMLSVCVFVKQFLFYFGSHFLHFVLTFLQSLLVSPASPPSCVQLP